MRKLQLRKAYCRVIPVIVLISSIVCIHTYYTRDNGSLFVKPQVQTTSKPVGFCRDLTRKFIVVTTINYPTESVKKLASLDGWCVIVVGDAKTPMDWSWPNCVYLSLEAQRDLGYRILEHVPQNHYGRKNIGYIYAIQRRAEVIYETDDDNILIGPELPLVPPSDLYLSLFPDAEAGGQRLMGKREVCYHVVNIYEYFGQPTTWPRGIPLECLATLLSPPEGIPHAYTTKPTQNGLLEREFQIGVDQGLANGDPDLDAIFRLTRIPANQKIQMEFNPKAPLVGIAKGIFSPYNSQNTVYYRDAFWGLLLPVTPTSRVCDIWRGYITQRLMWDVGLRLVFRSATVTQFRNPHNYVKDLDQERALYRDGGRLVNFLSNWDSSKAGGGGDIFSRMITLQKELVQENFMEVEDAALIDAWVDDLRSIGYEPPNVLELTAAPLDVQVPKTLAWILHFSYKPIPEVVDILLKSYAKHFALIVIVTPTGRPSDFPHFESYGTDVLWSSPCRNNHAKKKENPAGVMVRCYVRGLRILTSHPADLTVDYIVLSNDDVVLNVTKIREVALEGRPISHRHNMDRSFGNPPPMFSPLVNGSTYFDNQDRNGKWPRCQTIFSRIPPVYKDRYRKRWGDYAMSGAADAFFLPSDSVAEFIDLGSVVWDCWPELSLVTVLGLLTNPVRFSEFEEELFYYAWNATTPWGQDFAGYFSNKSVLAIHPFELSKPENRAAFSKFLKMCNVN